MAITVDPTTVGIGVSGVIFLSLGIVVYFHQYCSKFKTKADEFLKIKMKLIDNEFLNFISKTSKKGKNKWSAEDRRDLMKLSFFAYDLERLFKNSVSRMKDKISSSFLIGFLFGLLALFAGVVYNYSSSLAFLIAYFGAFIGYVYVDQSFYQFLRMRKIEKCMEDLDEISDLEEIKAKVRTTIRSLYRGWTWI